MQQWILAIKSVVITNSPLPLGRLLRSEVILSTIFGERINNKSFRTLADFELILSDLLPVNGSALAQRMRARIKNNCVVQVLPLT
jgi:hypothetical protein